MHLVGIQPFVALPRPYADARRLLGRVCRGSPSVLALIIRT